MIAPKEKLLALGMDEINAALYEEIIGKAANLEDLERHLSERNLPCDIEQFILPVFRNLYRQDGKIREGVRTGLKEFGLPDEMVDSYFTEMGNHPYLLLVLSSRYDSIHSKTKTRFSEAARETMFSVLKRYLEI